MKFTSGSNFDQTSLKWSLSSEFMNLLSFSLVSWKDCRTIAMKSLMKIITTRTTYEKKEATAKFLLPHPIVLSKFI